MVLFTRQLSEIEDLKSVREELEKQQARLEFKIWGDRKEQVVGEDTAEAQNLLRDIDQRIEEIDTIVDPEHHLNHVIDALTYFDQHLKISPLHLRTDKLGIKLDTPTSPSAEEAVLAQCEATGAPKRAAVWCRIKR